jgi:hypothetical protein
MHFDPSAVPEDEKSFDPVPAGDYLLQAVEADVVPTKTNSGTRLTLTLEIMEGDHAGRKIWEGINIANQSEEAQRIGQRQLADLCLSAGLTSVSNSDDLIGRPFRARVGIQQDKGGQYAPRNVVKRWHIAPAKLERAQAAQPPAAARPAATQTAPKPAPAQGARVPQTGPTPTKAAAGGSSSRPWATR